MRSVALLLLLILLAGLCAMARPGAADTSCITSIEAWVEKGGAEGQATLVIGVWTDGDAGFTLNRFKSPGQVALWSERLDPAAGVAPVDIAALGLGTDAVAGVAGMVEGGQTGLVFTVAPGYRVQDVALDAHADAQARGRGVAADGAQLACLRFPLENYATPSAPAALAGADGAVRVVCLAGPCSPEGVVAAQSVGSAAGTEKQDKPTPPPCATRRCPERKPPDPCEIKPGEPEVQTVVQTVAQTVQLYNTDAGEVAKIVRAIIANTVDDKGCPAFKGVQVVWPVVDAAKDTTDRVKQLEDDVATLQGKLTAQELAAEKKKLNEARCEIDTAVQQMHNIANALKGMFPAPESQSDTLVSISSVLDCAIQKLTGADSALIKVQDALVCTDDAATLKKCKAELQALISCLYETVTDSTLVSSKLFEALPYLGEKIKPQVVALKTVCDKLDAAGKTLDPTICSDNDKLRALMDDLLSKISLITSNYKVSNRNLKDGNLFAEGSSAAPGITPGDSEKLNTATSKLIAQALHVGKQFSNLSAATAAEAAAAAQQASGAKQPEAAKPEEKKDGMVKEFKPGQAESAGLTLKNNYDLIGGDMQLKDEKQRGMDTRPLVNMHTAQTNYIVLLGDSDKIGQLATYIKCLDCPPQIITLDVTICEFTQKGAKNLGLRLGSTAGPDGVAPKDGSPFAGAFTSFLEQATTGHSDTALEWFSLGDFARTDPLRFKAVLNALVQEGCAEIIAQPTLSTVSGRGVHYFAGDFIPYQESSTGTFADGITQTTITVGEKQVGIQLEFVPVYDANNNQIMLTILPQVTTLVEFTDVGNGVKYPRLGQRTLFETMSICPEETICLAGLIRDEDRVVVDKVPLLSELPIAGKLFRSKNRSHERTEICICVTAHLAPNTKEAGYYAEPHS